MARNFLKRPNRLALLTTTLAGMAVFPTSGARAACVVANGNEATCSGTDVGVTVQNTQGTFVSVTMQSGATITTDGVILLGDSARPGVETTYTEMGPTSVTGPASVISPTRFAGIYGRTSGAANVTITTAAGSIISARSAIVADVGSRFPASGVATIVNYATVVASVDGAYAYNVGQGAARVENYGSVTSLESGISALARGRAASASDTTNGYAYVYNEGVVNAPWAMNANSYGNLRMVNGPRGVLNAREIRPGDNPYGMGFSSSSIGGSTPSGASFIDNQGRIVSEGAGVDGFTSGGRVSIVNSGQIFAATSGVSLSSSRLVGSPVRGDVNIQNLATGVITSSGGSGIAMTNRGAVGGGVVAILNDGVITAATAGVDLDNQNRTSPSSVANTGSITGNVGMRLRAAGSVSVVNSGGVRGVANGVDVSGPDIAIRNLSAGRIESTAGAGVLAASAAGGSGAILVSNDGVVTGATAGVDLDNRRASGLSTIVNAGSLQGAAGAILIDRAAAGVAAPTRISNSGTIGSSPVGLAVGAGSRADGAVTIDNSGELLGRLTLTDNADILANHAGGTWQTTGASAFNGGDDQIANAGRLVTVDRTLIDMGAGANVVTNAGVLQVTNGMADGHATFAATGGALRFDNAGLIEMRDGARPTNTMVINGDYRAAGGALAVDAQLGAPGSTADRLIIAGAASGGQTPVVVRDLAGGLGAWNPVGVTVASIAGANSGGGFALSPSTRGYRVIGATPVIDKGLFLYALREGSGVGCVSGSTCYSLYSAPSSSAFMLPMTITAAQTIWQEAALGWDDRQTELRDASAGAASWEANAEPQHVAAATPLGITSWVKPLGAWMTRSAAATTNAGGAVLSFDLGYRQDMLGLLGGANYATAAPWGGVVNVGVLGGYIGSNVNFNDKRGWFRYEGGTVGASASYTTHGYFLDGLFKADLLTLRLGVPMGALENQTTSADTLGGMVAAGRRLSFGPYFIEPSAVLSYSATRIGGLGQLAALGVDVGMGDGADFRGGLGGRLGTESRTLVEGYLAQASLTGRVWDQFDSNGGRVARIVSGGVGQDFGDVTLGSVYGEVKGNLSLLSHGPGWGGYVGGGARFNGQFSSWTARGGVAYRW